MYNVAVTRKVCATCKWWRAERELVFAGAREPRYVVVDPAAISDEAAGVLARELCREISDRIRFPGQIRVTVVRELRCTEYAK